MITILGSFIGFISSLVPDIIRQFQDKRDKAHEIELMKLQIENQKNNSSAKLEEVKINSANLEAVEIYKTFYTGISWVDALNGTVRPVIAYAFFFLYAGLKLIQISIIDAGFMVWTEEDQAIFASIISFYFGSRAMQKLRK